MISFCHNQLAGDTIEIIERIFEFLQIREVFSESVVF